MNTTTSNGTFAIVDPFTFILVLDRLRNDYVEGIAYQDTVLAESKDEDWVDVYNVGWKLALQEALPILDEMIWEIESHNNVTVADMQRWYGEILKAGTTSDLFSREMKKISAISDKITPSILNTITTRLIDNEEWSISKNDDLAEGYCEALYTSEIVEKGTLFQFFRSTNEEGQRKETIIFASNPFDAMSQLKVVSKEHMPKKTMWARFKALFVKAFIR